MTATLVGTFVLPSGNRLEVWAARTEPCQLTLRLEWDLPPSAKDVELSAKIIRRALR